MEVREQVLRSGPSLIFAGLEEGEFDKPKTTPRNAQRVECRCCGAVVARRDSYRIRKRRPRGYWCFDCYWARDGRRYITG